MQIWVNVLMFKNTKIKWVGWIGWWNAVENGWMVEGNGVRDFRQLGLDYFLGENWVSWVIWV